MSVKVENLEHNMARITVEVSAEDFEKAMKVAYDRNKNRINVQGFRKGKAPRQLIERMYGPEIFFEDAANYAINESYEAAAEESGLTITSRPAIDVVEIGKGKAFIYTAEVAVRPAVTLGKYLGLEVPKTDVTVTDEDVEKEIDKEREKNARIVDVDDRAAQMGDTVTIDFEGFVDGEAFEGGKGENYDLVLGSGTFIPGFEEQLAGHNVDEDVEVNVRFPDDYNADALQGKEAVFKCVIHKIATKELPEADDDFAMDVSEFDTMEEYKADVRKNLTEEKEKSAKQAKENAAVDALVKEMDADIPDAMIDANLDNMERDYEMRLSQQGMTLEQYLQYMGMNRENFRTFMRPQALNSIKTRLALEEVVNLAGIEVSDERLDEELEKEAKSYGMEKEKLAEYMDEEAKKQMRLDIAVQDAITLIAENAVEVEKAKEEAEAVIEEAAEEAAEAIGEAEAEIEEA